MKILYLSAISVLCTTLYAEQHYFSQYQQDQIMNEKYFKGKTNGFFVEIGAYDGVTYSNTCFFERYLDWKGICIEPMKVPFEKLVQNRSCLCVNTCLSNFTGEANFLQISGGNTPGEINWAPMYSGLSEEYHPAQMQLTQKVINSYECKSEMIKVTCIPLQTLFDQQNITHVDYISLDVEGSELSILKGIDFSRTTIDFLTIENHHEHHKIRDFLKDRGYELIDRIACDDVFKRVR